ncbi:MAG: type III restriction endonuclease subunit R, partial [Alphaproteobacteria bacterium PA3]
NTVSGEDGDVLAVLKFLTSFLNDSAQAIEWIGDLVDDKARLLDPKGNDVFAGRFAPLMQRDAETIYADILRRLFNAEARQRLKLVNLKGSKGELALRVGNAPHFGVINIGDDAGFFKTAEDVDAFDTETDDFGSGLFGTINQEGSKLNVLIGSRKFTEGWSSWRVSTMGLLNMGQGEGSQIIQLFGRGVRLKGKGMSLKRSVTNERPKGMHLERLETLNIFGVRANYMAAFKDYLDGYKDNQIKGFKRTHFPWLYEVPTDFVGKIKQPHATLDLYPRIEALSTKDNATAKVAPDARHKGKLDRAAMAMFDWDAVFLALQEYKLLKTWSNLRLDRQLLIDFCTGSDGWYTLFIPRAELVINGFDDVTKQQGILVQLLTEYTDRFYQALKAGYEGQFYDVAYITDDHGSMLKLYQFEIDATDNGREYETKLKVLRDLVAAGKIGEASQWNAPHMVAISFARHLYYPLMAPDVTGNLPLKMRPLAFDSPSEVQFVRDLEAFYNSSVAKELLAGRSLYLLRNADTQAKGLGFARAGNFYPDFLLWLVDDATGQQWLSFVDPKGIRNLDLNDPKLGLYSEIKERQKELDDPDLILNAFILSYTRYSDLLNVGSAGSRAQLEERHVLFMDDGRDAYLSKLFQLVGA